MTNFYVADSNNAIIRITVSSCLVVFSYNYFSLFTFHLNVILLQNYHFSPFHPINYDTYNKKKRSLQHFSHFLQRKSPPRSHHNYQVDSFTSYYLPLTIHDSACEPGTRSWHLPPSTGCRWSWGTPGWSATWYPRR